MTADSRLEIQKAIIAALKGDGALSAVGSPALAGRVYDRPRAGVTFPYLSVSPGSMQPFDTQGMRGAEVEPVVHVWSRSGGRVEALAIARGVTAVLHEQPLTLDTQTQVLGRLELSPPPIDDPDGQTTHVVLRFRYLTQS